MIVSEKLVQISRPGRIEPADSVIKLIVDNQQKGISSLTGAVTIQTTPSFALTNWERPDSEILEMVLGATSSYLKISPVDYQIHRWKFSQVATTYPNPYFLSEAPALFALAGDAFSTYGDVEGAAISGLEVAEAIKTHLGRRTVTP